MGGLRDLHGRLSEIACGRDDFEFPHVGAAIVVQRAVFVERIVKLVEHDQSARRYPSVHHSEGIEGGRIQVAIAMYQDRIPLLVGRQEAR